MAGLQNVLAGNSNSSARVAEPGSDRRLPLSEGMDGMNPCSTARQPFGFVAVHRLVGLVAQLDGGAVQLSIRFYQYKLWKQGNMMKVQGAL